VASVESALDRADVDRWLADFLARLQASFGQRLLFVALHGSWARGEPRPGSDLDVAVVVDNVASRDLAAFHNMIAEMPDARALASGIFLSVPELKALRPFERISLCYGCRVLHGTLEGIIDPPGPADLTEHIQVIASANLFHARHYLLYPHDLSKVVHKLYYPFKECSYALQSWLLLREGRFILTKDELAGCLPGADDKEVIRVARHWHELEQDRGERPLYYIELLERWSKDMLLKLQTLPAGPPRDKEGRSC
jgi:uncharacterized protein